MDCSPVGPVCHGGLRPVLAGVKGRLGQRFAGLVGTGFVRQVVADLGAAKHFLCAGDRRLRHTVAGGRSFRRVYGQRRRAVLLFQRASIIDGAHALGNDGVAAIRDRILENVPVLRILRVNGGLLIEEGLLCDQLAARRSRVPASEENRRVLLRRSGGHFGDGDTAIKIGGNFGNFSGSAVYVKGYLDNAADACLYRRSLNLICREGNGQIAAPGLLAHFQLRIPEVLLGDNVAIAVQKNRHGDAGVHCLHGIVAEFRIDGIAAVVHFQSRVHGQLLAVVSCQQAGEADEAVVIVAVGLLGILHPGPCIHRKPGFGNLIAGKELGDVDCLDGGEDALVDIRVIFRRQRNRLADHGLVEGILIERQLDSLAAAGQRNRGVVAQHDLDVPFAVLLADQLHAGDAHVGTVQRQRAAAQLHAVADDRVSHIAYRTLGHVVGHQQRGGLGREQVQAGEILALAAHLRRNSVQLAGTRIGHGELHRHGEAGDDLINVHVSRHIRRQHREGAHCQLHRGDGLAIENIQVLRAVVVVGNGVARRRVQIDGVVDADALDAVVVAAEEDDVDCAVAIGVDVKVIDGVVLGRLRHIRGGGHAGHAADLEEANRVQLILAGVVGLVAFLALGPHQGHVGQLRIVGRGGEAEIRADARIAGAADALGEVDGVAAVGVDAGQADVVGHHRLIGGVPIVIVFLRVALACVVLGVPAQDEVAAVFIDRRHLGVGIGAAVVGQSSGGENGAVRADHGVEGLGGGHVLAGADGVGQERGAVGQHGGVDGVHRAGAAVVGNPSFFPGCAIINAVVDIVLHVEHGGDIPDLVQRIGGFADGVHRQSNVVDVNRITTIGSVGLADGKADLHIFLRQLQVYRRPVVGSHSACKVIPGFAAVLAVLHPQLILVKVIVAVTTAVGFIREREARIGECAQINGGKVSITTCSIQIKRIIADISVPCPPVGQCAVIKVFAYQLAVEVVGGIGQGGSVHAAPGHDGLAAAACHGGRHIGHGIVREAGGRPGHAIVGSGIDLGGVEHHAEIVIGDLGILLRLGRLHLLDPGGEGVVPGAAGDDIQVSQNVILGGVHAARIVIAAAVLDGVAGNAVHVVGVVVIGDVEEQLAVVGKGGVRIGIGIGLDVGHGAGCPHQAHAIGGAAGPHPLLQLQIVAAFQLRAAVDGHHGAAVCEQVHGIVPAASRGAEELAEALIRPIVLNLVVLIPLLRPVEAGGGEFLAVGDKQQLDLQLDADLAGDGELRAGLDAFVAGGEEQEVHVRADLAVNTKLQGHDGQVEAKAGERLNGHAQGGIQQHGASGSLVAEGHLQVGMEAHLEGDKRGIRAAHEGLAPLVLALDVGAHVAAAESDVPLAVGHACAGLQDDGAVEVELHGALSAGILFIILLLVHLLHFLLELAHILGQVLRVEVHGNAIFVTAALVGAHKGDDAEGRRVLGGQDHQADGVIPARSGQVAQEDEALADHVVDVDAAEDGADVGGFFQIFAHLDTDGLGAVVFIGKVGLMGNVGNAEGHAQIRNRQRTAGKYRFDAGCGRICRIVDAVRSHIGVRHHIGAAKHGDSGEREHEIGGAVQLFQVGDGLRRCQLGLAGELLAVGSVEGEAHGNIACVGGVAVGVHSHRLAGQGNIGIEHRLGEVGRNTNIFRIIYDVANIGGGCSAVQILLILLAGNLRCCGAASDILEGDNGIGSIAAHRIHDHITGLIAVDAILINILQAAGKAVVRRELGGVVIQRDLAVHRGENYVLPQDWVALLLRGAHADLRAVYPALIHAGAEGDLA